MKRPRTTTGSQFSGASVTTFLTSQGKLLIRLRAGAIQLGNVRRLWLLRGTLLAGGTS